MTKRDPAPALLSRRAALSALGGLGSVALFACTSSQNEDGTSSSSSGGSSSGGASSGGSSSSSSSSSGSATAWATGGTASMTGDYASPFPLAVACLVMTGVTEGPCTEEADQVRSDISEGYGGLPMRLALRFVDAECSPLEGAKVKIWHTQRTGSYSGDTPNPGMCLSSSAEGDKHYFRGVQTTTADGRVDFDSCFPGWYRGRAVHIHFTVSKGGRELTSQLAFDPALVTELFESHPDYAQFGQPDTPNASDNIVGGSGAAKFVLATSRLDDGALMAAKEIRADL